MHNYLPERALEPPAFPPPNCICSDCEGWFYDDDAMFVSNGRYLCPDCFRDELNMLGTTELARLIGAVEIQAKEAGGYGRMRHYLR